MHSEPKPSLFTRCVVTSLPLVPRFLVGRVASRYVAGETLEDALRTVRQLNDQGAAATLDLLGEEVHERDKASAAVTEYLRMFGAIREAGLKSTISVKLTSLGLKIDEAFCLDNLRQLMAEAARHDLFVRLDMEDRTTIDATLRIYRQLHAEHGGRVGVVFQAYMRRTLSDIAALPSEGANVRICKGIYIEPRTAAWKGFNTVRHNFVAALEKLLRQGVFVGIATHDEFLVCAAVALIDRLGVPRERYEFQMLLGVEESLRQILIAEGHRMRIYVPYGREWYAYSMRRLRENPNVAGHVIRATLRGGR